MIGLAGRVGSVTLPIHVPRYRQIMDDLRRRIAEGELAPGSKLPTTRKLAEHYGTTPGTVRAAVERLLDAGELVGRQGSGVYVPKL